MTKATDFLTLCWLLPKFCFSAQRRVEVGFEKVIFPTMSSQTKRSVLLFEHTLGNSAQRQFHFMTAVSKATHEHTVLKSQPNLRYDVLTVPMFLIILQVFEQRQKEAHCAGRKNLWWTLLINKRRHRQTLGFTPPTDRAAADWVHFNSAPSWICSCCISGQSPSALSAGATQVKARQ